MPGRAAGGLMAGAPLMGVSLPVGIESLLGTKCPGRSVTVLATRPLYPVAARHTSPNPSSGQTFLLNELAVELFRLRSRNPPLIAHPFVHESVLRTKLPKENSNRCD